MPNVIKARPASIALAHIVDDTATFHAAFKATAFRTFKIPKKDGGEREIHAPSERLKAAQKHALRVLQDEGHLTHQDEDHGFVTGRGIHTMLATNQPPRRLIQADLERAFHQITETDVRAWAFSIGANSRVARWLSRGTCRPIPGLDGARLVMGSPLAPAILLTLTAPLRAATGRLARVYGGKATWYADNIVLEVPARHVGAAKRSLTRLIRGQRWTVKTAPSEDVKVLGWTWHGIGSHLWGWRANRKLRKAARGKLPRLDRVAAYAEATGNKAVATARRAQAQGIRTYLRGPAQGRPLAPAYAAAML